MCCAVAAARVIRVPAGEGQEGGGGGADQQNVRHELVVPVLLAARGGLEGRVRKGRLGG